MQNYNKWQIGRTIQIIKDDDNQFRATLDTLMQPEILAYHDEDVCSRMQAIKSCRAVAKTFTELERIAWAYILVSQRLHGYWNTKMDLPRALNDAKLKQDYYKLRRHWKRMEMSKESRQQLSYRKQLSKLSHRHRLVS